MMTDLNAVTVDTTTQDSGQSVPCVESNMTAEEAVRKHNSEMDDKGFYALHPFSRDCEGIWDINMTMWFTSESYAQACDDV